jgi:hypothetical protein
VSISDFNKSGLKCVFFVMKFFSCPFCLSAVDDIYNLHDSLLKNGCVPILIHSEKDEDLEKYYKTSERKTEYLRLHRIATTDVLLDYLEMKHHSMLQGLVSMTKLMLGSKTITHLYDTKTASGVKEFMDNAPKDNDLSMCLSCAFVVQDRQVIFHTDCANMSDRLDIARIVIETETDGPIEFTVHKEAYACIKNPLAKPFNIKKPAPMQQIMSDKKSSLSCIAPGIEEEVPVRVFVKNPKDFKMLKTFMTKEYNVENINFYESIQEFRSIEDNKLLIPAAARIFEMFFSEDSPNLLNVTKEQTETVRGKLENPEIAMFDDVLNENVMSAMRDSFLRLQKSDMYHMRNSHARTFVISWK